MYSREIEYGDMAHFDMERSASGLSGSSYDNYSVTLTEKFQGKEMRLEYPRSGISLMSCRFVFSEDTSIPFEIGSGAFTIGLVMSGQSACSWGKEFSVSRPRDMMFLSEDYQGRVSFAGKQEYLSVGVVVDRRLLLEMTEGEARFAGLERMLKCRRDLKLLGSYAPSPVTQLLAKQLFGCPLCGSCRRLYLESKTLELLAFSLDRLVEADVGTGISLSHDDVERIREARRVLFRDMVDPPTIKGLARLVGVNEFKLKKGFREVFGCTVYQSLRIHRMESARTLLEDTDMTVGAVAAQVGYTNMSHFSSAFRAHYGVNPGSLLSYCRRRRIA